MSMFLDLISMSLDLICTCMFLDFIYIYMFLDLMSLLLDSISICFLI